MHHNGPVHHLHEACCFVDVLRTLQCVLLHLELQLVFRKPQNVTFTHFKRLFEVRSNFACLVFSTNPQCRSPSRDLVRCMHCCHSPSCCSSLTLVLCGVGQAVASLQGLRRLQLEDLQSDPAIVVAVVVSLPHLAALRAAVTELADAHLDAICEVLLPARSPLCVRRPTSRSNHTPVPTSLDVLQ